jgi:hypothetical protein
LIDSWRRPVTLAAALRVERTRAIIFFGDRMGRIRQLIRVDGRECWTLFDTGARNTYVVPQVASLLSTAPTHRPFRSALGGKVLETNTVALLEADVEGHRISTHAMVVDYIGTDEDGRSIEILFGALAMQQWGIRPVPDEERLDLSHYPEEFVEF